VSAHICVSNKGGSKRGRPAGALVLAALLGGLTVWLTGLFSSGPSASAFLPRAAPAAAMSASFSGIGEPTAVAVLQQGDLLVADVGQAGVRRFASDGRLQAAYGDPELLYPTGLAVDESDRVWVADLWLRRVYRVDLATGRFDEVSPEPSGYLAPGALAYRDGRLYVADLDRQQILVLNALDGRLLRALGRGAGREAGQFAYPNGIWPAASGEVFVADTGNQRIQVFGSDGQLQRILEPPGLYNPRGLAQDRRGRLHVVDSVANEIVVLDPRAGDVLERYGARESLVAPMGLALSRGRAYVADRGNARVVAWELGE
jgi:sugar lactone lactonase YvrE